MAKNIKGITIELDGDTTGLTQALKDVDSQTKSVQTELKAVDRLLKFDPTNITLLAQKQELLGDAVDNTKKRLDTLKQAQSQVQQQFQNGEIGAEQYRAFQREIAATQGKLETFQRQLKNTGAKLSVDADTSGIDKMKSALKELPSAAKAAGKEIGDVLKTGAAAGTAAVTTLVIGSNELNTDLARLKTNAESAGRDLGTVQEAFKQVAQVSGETDSAVETVSNLLASGFSDEQLSKVIDNVNGAAIRFSDTLKTEGIADGIQETFATGAAVGQFGELLERSGINLDDFNAKLAATTSDGERADLILQTMSDLGLSQVTEKYKELNPEVTKNNEATIEMQTALSKLALVLTPLITMITELITKFVEWATENPTLATTLAVVSGAIAGISSVFMALSPIISAVTSLWPVLSAAIGAISAPVAIAVAAVAGLIAIGIALYKNWDEVSAWLKKIWESIKAAAVSIFTVISNTISTIWDKIKTVTSVVWETIKLVISTAIGAVKNKVTSDINNLKSIVSTVFNAIKATATTVWNSIKTAIVTPFNAAKDAVKKAIDTIKGLFDFEFKWPKLPMPHFTVSGTMNPLKWIDEGVPKIGVEWYAKGGILTKPTIFGMNGNNMMIGGEVPGVKEAVLPLNAETLAGIGKGIAEQMSVGEMPSTIIVQSVLDGRVIAESTSQIQFSKTNLNALTRGVSL